ncbi:hypothetical protein [Thiosulfatihalobacter marinus]|uniref:hypothetical protein n=1 Tax=Thiosulfatihalobacter marinus TaxID=2792481 RepID=UPI0018D5B4CA|nr:hypothetical protein [Thiosulfatihalobacter marinus]
MTEAYAPDPFEGLDRKERRRLEVGIDRVVEKVTSNVIVRKSPKHLLREVYMAGLYHGSQAGEGWPE